MVHSMIGVNSPFDRLRQKQKVTVRREVKPLRAGGFHTRLTRSERSLVERLLLDKMDFIDSEEFYRSGAEQRIYADAPQIDRPDVSWYRPLMDDLTSRSQAGNASKPRSSVVLTGAEERVLFLKYNYARYRVGLLQEKLDGREPDEQDARDLLHWYGIATSYREQIAETNLALVLAMAKRTRMSEVDFADLVSEGNMALLRSVDKFDCERGFKFSTYACRAILKAFSRQGMKLSKYRQRFPTDFDPAMEKSHHLEELRREHELENASEVKHIVLSNQAELSDVERTVLEHRFGIEHPEDHIPLTLEQVGQIIGVTKERVRQIQNKALAKVRVCFEEAQDARLDSNEGNDVVPSNN